MMDREMVRIMGQWQKIIRLRYGANCNNPRKLQNNAWIAEKSRYVRITRSMTSVYTIGFKQELIGSIRMAV